MRITGEMNTCCR